MAWKSLAILKDTRGHNVRLAVHPGFTGLADYSYGPLTSPTGTVVRATCFTGIDYAQLIDGTYVHPAGTVQYLLAGGGVLRVVITQTGTVRGYNFSILDNNLSEVARVGISISGSNLIMSCCVAYNDETKQAFIGLGYSSISPSDDTLQFAYYKYNVTNNIYDAINGNFPAGGGSDPLEPGGTSDVGGGGGDFDDTSDDIEVPGAPVLNFSVGKFITAYAPTKSELDALADYLWTGFMESWDVSKLFTDPMDAILSLHMVPFSVPSSTAIPVTIGNHMTTVNMSPATLQFVDIDCGSLEVKEYWGNYLDYNPYTKLKLVLPYIGEVDLDPDEVMRETLSVKYRCDITTGSLICFVSTATKVLGQYMGECALKLPVTREDYTQLHNSILSIATTAAGALATAASGGMTAPIAIGALANTAANTLNAKVNFDHTGSLAGSGGFMAIQTPYLLIHRANQCLPENFNQLKGYPSLVTRAFGDLEGYTEIEEIELNGLPFTSGELEELKTMLGEGVIL